MIVDTYMLAFQSHVVLRELWSYGGYYVYYHFMT